MIKLLNQIIPNKKILILGFGKEGRSSYKILGKFFPNKIFTVADKDHSLKKHINTDAEYKNINFILGNKYLDNLNDFDLIIKTPGISLKNISYKIPKNKITSQSDIFLRAFGKQTIGVTGTKGKSTTASLIFHTIKLSDNNSVLIGNIGIPPFESLPDINTDTKIIFELSSHQLEHICVSPHISILLNIFEEHLDFYQSFENYKNIKFNILRFQQKDDFFICNSDDKIINEFVNSFEPIGKSYGISQNKQLKNGSFIKDNTIIFSQNGKISKIFNLNKKRFLSGTHNLTNIMAAINCCKILNIPDNQIVKGISTFKGLEHRIEYVGKFGNIHFYNDSIATIPEATIEAINTLGEIDTLILGGFDRGINYRKFAEFINRSEINNLIFTGKAGKRMLSEIKKLPGTEQKYFTANDFEEVFDIIKKHSTPVSVCLLSPAAASYDIFKNFEERGNVFKKLAKNL